MSNQICPKGTHLATHEYIEKHWALNCNTNYEQYNIYKPGEKDIDYKHCVSKEPMCVLGELVSEGDMSITIS